MKILASICFLVIASFAHVASADKGRMLTAKSPENRVALLELYTSQGCSSCPPAERWVSNLKKSGVSSSQLIPLAFHVTYWDYIGWRDRYGSDRYDQRQRRIARYNDQRTIYTPQFVLAGSDYRSYNRFTNDVREIVSQPASVSLELTARAVDMATIDVDLSAAMTNGDKHNLALFLAVYEDDLSNHVDDGENEGETLHHDFVVRQLYGPFIQNMETLKASVKQSVEVEPGWKKKDLNLVAFAQNPETGEIMQALRLELEPGK